MNWLPFGNETLVSALSRTAFLHRLTEVTKGDQMEGLPEIRPLFNGRVDPEGFCISQAIDKGDSFLPLLVGRVEETPIGCIVFVRYKLFPTTRFFLWFWTSMLLSFSLYFFLVAQQTLQGVFCLILLGLNYTLAVFFFHWRLAPCKKLFKEVLSSPSNHSESSP